MNLKQWDESKGQEQLGAFLLKQLFEKANAPQDFVKQNAGPMLGGTLGSIAGPAGAIYGAGAGRFLQNVAEEKSGTGPDGLLEGVPTDVAITAGGEALAGVLPYLSKMLKQSATDKPVIANIYSENGVPVNLQHGTNTKWKGGKFDREIARQSRETNKAGGGNRLQTDNIYLTNDPKWASSFNKGEGDVYDFALDTEKMLNFEAPMDPQILEELKRRGFITQKQVEDIQRSYRDRELNRRLAEHREILSAEPTKEELLKMKQEAWKKAQQEAIRNYDVENIVPKIPNENRNLQDIPVVTIPELTKPLGYDSAKYLRSRYGQPDSWNISPYDMSQVHPGKVDPNNPFWRTPDQVAEILGANKNIDELSEQGKAVVRNLYNLLRDNEQ